MVVGGAGFEGRRWGGVAARGSIGPPESARGVEVIEQAEEGRTAT